MKWGYVIFPIEESRSLPRIVMRKAFFAGSHKPFVFDGLGFKESISRCGGAVIASDAFTKEYVESHVRWLNRASSPEFKTQVAIPFCQEEA